MWSLVFPYLDFETVARARRAHKLATLPYPRNAPAVGLRFVWLKNGKLGGCFRQIEVEWPLPQPSKVDKYLSYYAHDPPPLYANTRQSLGYTTLKNFTPQSSGWGFAAWTRVKRFAEYLDVFLGVVDTNGHFRLYHLDWERDSNTASSWTFAYEPTPWESRVPRIMLQAYLRSTRDTRPEVNVSLGERCMIRLALGSDTTCLVDLFLPKRLPSV